MLMLVMFALRCLTPLPCLPTLTPLTLLSLPLPPLPPPLPPQLPSSSPWPAPGQGAQPERLPGATEGGGQEEEARLLMTP